MKAVILAGGLSTSLEPLTQFYHKSMLPILNKPLIEHTIGFFRLCGIEQIVICINGDSTQIVDYVGNGRKWGVDVSWVKEANLKGTAGCLLGAKDVLSRDSFMVIDCSVFPDFNYNDFLRFHREKRSIATIGVNRIENDHRLLERVSLTTDQRVSHFSLTHPSKDRRSSFFPVGVYIFDAEILSFIPTHQHFDLKEQLVPALVHAGYYPYTYELENYCMNIRTVLDYWQANYCMLKANSNNTHPGENLNHDVMIGENCTISDTSLLVGPLIIGDNSTVEDNCKIIGPAVLGRDCHISQNTVIRDSILLKECHLPQNSMIEHCICQDQQVISLNGTSPIANNLKGPRSYKIYKSKYSRPPFQATLKRIFDLIFSITVLLFYFPLMIITSLVIKLDSPGPIFFRQTRCGKDGKEFQVFKFRTMEINSENLKERLLKNNITDGPTFKVKNDPRVTRAGKIIRQLSLDEFPQLFNVLQGNMSVVGPRPLSMEEMNFNAAWRDIRLAVKPGITGPWQISGDHRHFFHKWIEEDFFYVKNWSFLTDIKILLKTALWFCKSALTCLFNGKSWY